MVQMRWVEIVVVIAGLALAAGCGDDDAAGGGTGGGRTGGGASEQGGSSAGGRGGAGGSTSSGGTQGGSSGANAGTSGSTGGRGGQAGASTGGTNGGAGSGAAGDDGGAAPSCEDQPCPDGQHCELVEVQCIRAPCPPLPMCMPDGATGGSGSSGPTSCDLRQVTCRRAEPECPEGQVPSLDGACYGECVPIENCTCSDADECPHRDTYVCHMSAGHCGPYL